MKPVVYVSITGLRLKRPWHIFRSYRHAVPSFRQARSAKGNLQAEVKTINGIHHTLTVWDTAESMRDFIYSGAHLKAIQAFGRIATGKTFGFETDQIPEWEAVHRLWRDHAQDYQDAA